MGKLYNYLLKASKMGNQEFQIPQHVRAEWREEMVNGKKLLQNKLTLQIFQFLVLSKLEEPQNIARLIERSIYSIPKTPKIIILNDQEGELFLLIQQIQYSLVEYLPKLQLAVDALALLEKITHTLSCLLKKYGPFHVTQNTVGINKNQDIMVWINQDKYKNTPSLPLPNTQDAEKIMVDEMLSIFVKNTHLSLERQLSLHACPSLEKLQICLTKLIDRKKREMTQYFGQDRNKERIITRALSPQTSFGNKMGLLKCPTQKVISSAGLNKRNVLPKFVQKMKEKKTCLLDSLHHRRTLTREESQIFLTKQNSKVSIYDQSRRKRNNSPEKSLNKNSSAKLTPKKENQMSQYKSTLDTFKQVAQFPPTLKPDHYENLTASGSTNNCQVKKREFSDIAIIKSCGDSIPAIEKHTKTYSYPNSPSTLDNCTTYWPQNADSCLFESFQRVTKDSAPETPLQGKRSLGLYCGNTAESKYIGQVRKDQMIIEQQSASISKTLQDEFNDFFSNPSRSPRITLGVMNESLELAKEFGKIIDC